jgi:hypothetical protein
MRAHLSVAISLLVAIAAIGCGRESVLGPTLTQESALTSDTPAHDGAIFDRLSSQSASFSAVETNPVVFWNRIVRELGVDAKLPPPMLARAYALVQVGIYQALVPSEDRLSNLPRHALTAGVASRVLGYLFPAKLTRIEAAIAGELAQDVGSAGAARGAWALGRSVGRAVVSRAQSDGADAVYTGTPPSGDGIWTGTNPVLPMCGTWKTWVIASGSEIQPEAPYAYGSTQDLQDVQEVLDVSLARTAEQIAIVHKWADVSPPAIWNDMLNDRIEAAGLDVAASARAHAFLNMAMADGFIECWACKYTYWTARPFQRIPGLVTVITTPNFPSYTSGHSTISAAAAKVMGEVFPADADFFQQQAEEAAMSRLYGGIHFRHDNEQGIFVGAIIGDRVVERMRATGGGNLLAGR